ncbi:MAG: hypothetical protein ACYTGP_06090 [Planctomycetota bacterium]
MTVRLLGLLVLTLLAGCASAGKIEGPNYTGGRTWMMYTAHKGAITRFHVDPAGTLQFAGGKDAMFERYTWEGPLKEDELTRLVEMMDEVDWFDVKYAKGDKDERFWEVSELRGGKRRKAEIRGEYESLLGVYDLLSTAARRRYGEFLESMPKSGRQ